MRASVFAGWLLAAFVLAGGAAGVMAQRVALPDDPQETRAAIARAQQEAAAAKARGDRLEEEARTAIEAAEKTANEAAALAARVQQAEAGIAASEGRIALIEDQRRALNRRLAERREPLIRLTGALQKLARRPVALAALRPGSLRETVYLRALLESTIPEVRKRTASLRAEIERGRILEREAQQALVALRQDEGTLAQQRKRLAAIESRQRLESRRATGEAYRESQRALALAEEARDLDSLVEELDAAGSLRAELAALPGPVMRPARPESEGVAPIEPAPSQTSQSRIAVQLPVTGRTVTGFGVAAAGTRSTGITLAPRERAQIVAPAAGRVVFAGPFRGFDRIVIIEHDTGWTSLITGLARVDVAVGDTPVAGAPIGIAGMDRPLVTFELRRDGKPVNPLDYAR